MTRKFHFEEKIPFKRGVRRHGYGFAWWRADAKYRAALVLCENKDKIAVNVEELKAAVVEHKLTHVACRSLNIEDILLVEDVLEYIERNPRKVQKGKDGPFALLSVVDVSKIAGYKADPSVEEAVSF